MRVTVSWNLEIRIRKLCTSKEKSLKKWQTDFLEIKTILKIYRCCERWAGFSYKCLKFVVCYRVWSWKIAKKFQNQNFQILYELFTCCSYLVNWKLYFCFRIISPVVLSYKNRRSVCNFQNVAQLMRPKSSQKTTRVCESKAKIELWRQSVFGEWARCSY